jgi:hypothetical protein
MHKNLFEDYIKDKDVVQLEPYKVWEYYNQKCTLTQAFDKEINSLDEVREIGAGVIHLSKFEQVDGYKLAEAARDECGKSKLLVIQPFGRSVTVQDPFIVDPSGRSFELANLVELLTVLRKKFSIMIMSEIPIPIEEFKKHKMAHPQIPDLRVWASIIKSADHFLGCDSVGQHIAKAVGTTATVVTGATFPENITYENDPSFDIIDVGKSNGRIYSAIRITEDELTSRANEGCMVLNDAQKKAILTSVGTRGGKSTVFTKPDPIFPEQEEESSCCPTSAPSSKAPSSKAPSSKAPSSKAPSSKARNKKNKFTKNMSQNDMADAGMLVCDLPRNSKEQPDGPAAPVNTNPPAPIENPLLKEKQSPTVLLRDSELNETQIREGFEAVQKASAHTNLSYDEMTTLHNSVQENLNDPSVSIEPLEIFKKRKEVNSEEK